MNTASRIELPSSAPSRSMASMKATAGKARFSRVYEEYKDSIYTFVLFRVGHDRDVTEDIVSDVFLKAYKNYDSYNPEYKITTWLYAIARNTLVDHYRRGRSTIDIDAVQAADETDPLYVLVTEDISLSEVERAIDELPEMQQVALREQFFNGKTAKEVATELGISHAAARKHVSRAMASLRSALLQVAIVISQCVTFII